jgi:hypothetical protein
MTSLHKFCFGLFISLLLLSQITVGQQLSGWKNDSTQIRTKHIKIDFAKASQLKSMINVLRTRSGLQAADTLKEATVVSEIIRIPVNNVAPFLAVGSRLVFSQPGNTFKGVRLEIRHSTNTQEWTGWQVIIKDDHLTTSRDMLVGTLQYLPKERRFVQVRVSLEPSGEGQKLQMYALDLSFTSPGATPTEQLQKIRQKTAGRGESSAQAKGDYPMPEYVTRTEWDCPDGQEPSGPVSLTTVTHQIVHHSAGTNSSSDWPAVVRSIWDYHVNTNGWSDIGYNWLVDPNGVIYQGRGWVNGDDEVQGAHFCGTNSNTMGVCVMGNFEEVSPTSDAQASLEELLAWKSDENNIDPTARQYHSSSGVDLYTISGHRDGCSTLCPGENLYVRLSQIRQNVNAKIGELPDGNGEKNIVVEKNYPNPFSESTTITFTPDRPGMVRITIWDVAGRMVEELTDAFYEAETHSETWNASNHAAGTYFYQVTFEGKAMVQKMVLIK